MDMQMLIEAVGMFSIVAGLMLFCCACAWSVRTLKANIGYVFNPRMIAGIFAFYNLIVKINNGNAAIHNYIIGLIALAVIVLDALAVHDEYGGKAALARVLSAVYGVVVFVIIAMALYNLTNGGGKKHEDEK